MKILNFDELQKLPNGTDVFIESKDKVKSSIGKISRDKSYIDSIFVCNNLDYGYAIEQMYGFKTSYKFSKNAMDDYNIYLNNNNNNNMNLIETFRRIGLKEPEKSLIDLGFMNKDEELTSDGQTLFLTWLLQQHKDKFFEEIVKPIKAYEDEKSKKDNK